jgi:hypothetical protein
VWPSREERFWTKVVKGPGCWEWSGAKNSNGYGTLGTGPRGTKRIELAHRVSWELAHGRVPVGFVLHRCDNPPCVRPTHLYEGSPADNVNDREARGRGVILRGDAHPQRIDPSKVLRGERHGMARLTVEDVRAIRARRARGEKLRTISVDFGIKEAQVSAIVSRRNWAHVD